MVSFSKANEVVKKHKDFIYFIGGIYFILVGGIGMGWLMAIADQPGYEFRQVVAFLSWLSAIGGSALLAHLSTQKNKCDR